MNLASKKVIGDLLKKHFARPEKRLGQHFLIDKKVLRKIIRAANLKPEDIVLEVGPGIGNLTQELAKKVKKVITIEKDSKMIEILRETMKDLKNIKVIQADILKINIKSEILNRKYKIVANLPYYIVSPVIRKFLESVDIRYQPTEMVLMVQKEVAQRICAKPPDMNLLAVSVQFYSKPEIISYVSKKSFWPQPKVDSAIIKITPFDPKKVFAWAHSHFASQRRASAFRMLFFKIVKAGFSQPRKQILNNLTKRLELNQEGVKNWLLKNKIKPSQRAETLSIQDWLNLTKTYRNHLL